MKRSQGPGRGFPPGIGSLAVVQWLQAPSYWLRTEGFTQQCGSGYSVSPILPAPQTLNFVSQIGGKRFRRNESGGGQPYGMQSTALQQQDQNVQRICHVSSPLGALKQIYADRDTTFITSQYSIRQ